MTKIEMLYEILKTEADIESVAHWLKAMALKDPEWGVIFLRICFDPNFDIAHQNALAGFVRSHKLN